ncbi:MAG: RNA polymerase sigma factor [Alphaproteobacteria bacterium]|nr:RNA polymerase sigma factor [Alphaproteobacteria bacterium]
MAKAQEAAAPRLPGHRHAGEDAGPLEASARRESSDIALKERPRALGLVPVSGEAAEADGSQEDAALSDEVLLKAVAGGSGRAFRVLSDRYLGFALALARRMVGNGHDAEEIAQEALIRLWQNAGVWEPRGSRFKTWFYRVVTNLSIDRLRQRTPEQLDESFELTDPAQGPHEHLQARQARAGIDAALSALPPRQKAAIMLCYFQELSNREAATSLGVSVKALEALLVRARTALRRTLADGDLDLG